MSTPLEDESAHLGIIRPAPRDPADTFQQGGRPMDLTVGRFWSWSMSDLVVNTNRGLLAEFIVAQALGDARLVRDPWQSFDVNTRDGLRIEVKASGYVQAWGQQALSPVAFGIGRTRGWDSETAQFDADQKRQADLYVFAILDHRDQRTIDPLNLDQWAFVVVRTADLDANLAGQKSVRLSRILDLPHVKTDYAGLFAAVRQQAGL